jgi:OmpA-OmpF porin, OOP family
MQLVVRQRTLVALVLAAGLGMSSGALADDQKHVSGVITDHTTEGTLMLQTDESSPLTVVVNESTSVQRSRKILRSERLSADVLKPGLRVRVDGTYETPSIFVARRITVTKEDLRTARAIEGGLVTTGNRLDQQGEQIAAARAALHATNARISSLDEYTVIQSMTVYFPNGKADIAAKYMAQLEEFATQVKGVRGSIVQVQAYASAVGSQAFNQQLTRRRADAVTAVLQQSGITPTDMAVPAAMGTTGQVASNQTATGQAQNRRAVVTLLQNKGVVGK